MSITKQTKTIIFTAILTLSIGSLIILIFYNLQPSVVGNNAALFQAPAMQAVETPTQNAPTKNEVELTEVQQGEALQVSAPSTTIQQPMNITRMVVSVAVLLIAIVAIGGVAFMVFRTIKKKQDANFSDTEQDGSQTSDIEYIEPVIEQQTQQGIEEARVNAKVSEQPAPAQVVITTETEQPEQTNDLAEALKTIEALELEVERLKEKSNLQLDCIEKLQKNQVGTDLIANIKLVSCVIDAFKDLEKGELVYKPQNQKEENQGFIYVSSADFIKHITKQMPDIKKKDILEVLMQFEVVSSVEKEQETIYKKKRVLKVNEKHFIMLTKGIAVSAEA